MKRDIDKLVNTDFDLVVVGGGIFGAWCACDAAKRGLSVALIERNDFCSSTSANHLKMMHGGIRYIQHGDFARVRHSCEERQIALKTAPHNVRPLPIAVPTYGWGMKSKLALRIGFAAYDLITFDRNKSIPDPDRKIPLGTSFSRAKAIKMFPGLDQNGLTGAGVFCDGQIQNPPRLVLAVIQSAVESGAEVANYVEAIGMTEQDGKITSLTAKDNLTGTEFSITGRSFINAAGPFAEKLLKRSIDRELNPNGVYSRDASFVVAKRLLPEGFGLATQTKNKDPDAMFSRGARHLFMASWREYTLIGVWHVVWKEDPDKAAVTREELESFISEAKEAYPALDFNIEDVSLINTGLVPFGENEDGAEDLRYGHRSRIIDHAKTDQINNLTSLIGVRFTTGRVEACKAVDLTIEKLGKGESKTSTDYEHLHGGDIEHYEQFVANSIERNTTDISSESIANLVSLYGTNFERVLELAEEDPSLGATIEDELTIAAQVIYAIRYEMAQTMADVVLRRTDLGTGTYPGKSALKNVAQIMSTELGWNQDKVESEIKTVTDRYNPLFVAKRDSS